MQHASLETWDAETRLNMFILLSMMMLNLKNTFDSQGIFCDYVKGKQFEKLPKFKYIIILSTFADLFNI